LLAWFTPKEKSKLVNTSGFIHPIAAKNKKGMVVVAQPLLITLSVVAESSNGNEAARRESLRLSAQN
jgi:hypothetical protein